MRGECQDFPVGRIAGLEQRQSVRREDGREGEGKGADRFFGGLGELEVHWWWWWWLRRDWMGEKRW